MSTVHQPAEADDAVLVARRYADAYAAFDAVVLLEVLAPHLLFRQVNPGDETVLAARMNDDFSVFPDASFPAYTLSRDHGAGDGGGHESACQGPCAVYWPPLLTSERPEAGPGVDQRPASPARGARSTARTHRTTRGRHCRSTTTTTWRTPSTARTRTANTREPCRPNAPGARSPRIPGRRATQRPNRRAPGRIATNSRSPRVGDPPKAGRRNPRRSSGRGHPARPHRHPAVKRPNGHPARRLRRPADGTADIADRTHPVSLTRMPHQA